LKEMPGEGVIRSPDLSEGRFGTARLIAGGLGIYQQLFAKTGVRVPRRSIRSMISVSRQERNGSKPVYTTHALGVQPGISDLFIAKTAKS
jgi:hypothetical protein